MAVGDTDTDPEGSRVLFAEIVRMHSNACPGIHHARRETLSPGSPTIRFRSAKKQRFLLQNAAKTAVLCFVTIYLCLYTVYPDRSRLDAHLLFPHGIHSRQL